MSFSELDTLSEEIRDLIIRTVSRNGGHLSSNLGVVELTLALHRVFRTPEDTIIWDVGHQCYTHKLITGRRDAFSGLRKKDGISGFPKRSESPHDAFDTGHASTSISTALGMLEARKFLGEPGKVIAVIGDGALNGGMAFEALNHAGQSMLPLIIILNDNKMSISPVVGSLSRYLSRLSATAPYQTFRTVVDRTVRGIPRYGARLFALMMRGKRAVKAFFYKENLFSDLGFEYIGPLDGHDIAAMTEILGDVRRLDRPCVVHVITHKGRGHSDAEYDPASFHGVAPPRISILHTSGDVACADFPGAGEASGGVAGEASGGVAGGVAGLPAQQGPSRSTTYTDVFSASLVELARTRCNLVAITAAMSKGTGLEAFKAAFPSRFHDVGIAEQHAVTYAAGLAAGGLLPVVAIYSTFMQRAVDQVFHDVALQGLHVVFAVDRTGLVPDDGETHQGIYDLSMFRSMPGISILAPATGADLDLCLRWALDATGPVMIRYPKAGIPAEIPACRAPVIAGRGLFLRKTGRARVLVIGSGILAASAFEVASRLGAEGVEADVYSLRFLAPLDPEYIADLARPYEGFLCLEENAGSGGIGETIAAMIGGCVRNPSGASIPGGCPGAGGGLVFIALSVPPQPFPQGTRDELLARAGLSSTHIEAAIRRTCFAVSGRRA